MRVGICQQYGEPGEPFATESFVHQNCQADTQDQFERNTDECKNECNTQRIPKTLIVPQINIVFEPDECIFFHSAESVVTDTQNN